MFIYDKQLILQSRIPKLLNHYPQGSSLETLLHYRQIMISGNCPHKTKIYIYFKYLINTLLIFIIFRQISSVRFWTRWKLHTVQECDTSGISFGEDHSSDGSVLWNEWRIYDKRGTEIWYLLIYSSVYVKMTRLSLVLKIRVKSFMINHRPNLANERIILVHLLKFQRAQTPPVLLNRVIILLSISTRKLLLIEQRNQCQYYDYIFTKLTSIYWEKNLIESINI